MENVKNSPVKFIGAGLNIPTPQAIQQAKQLGAQAQQNPFSPTEQGTMGGVFNPTGNDINQFQTNQGFNKSKYNVGYGQPEGALNPNTYNEPPIPTEAETTMNDLQMANAPMGDDMTGGMMNRVGLPPEQGMGSTQTGGVTANLTRDERRAQRRERRANRWRSRIDKKRSDKEYRRTGQRSGAMGGAILPPQGN